MIDRILLAGLGSIGQRHLGIITKLLPNADVRVLRHGNEPIEKQGVNFIGLNDLKLFQPQISVIANPAPYHLDLAMKLASYGSHIFVEKPISHNQNDVAKLIKLADHKKITLMVGYNLRFLESLKTFRDLIMSGKVGVVQYVQAQVGQYLPSWRPGRDYRKSVSASSKLGGGVLLELSHEIDYLRWVFGEVSWVMGSTYQQSKLEIDVEDTAMVVLGIKPGNNRPDFPASLTLDFIRHDSTRVCVAIGSLGSLRWDGITGKVEIYLPEAMAWATLYEDKNEMSCVYENEWTHFLNCIERDIKPDVCGHDGLMATRVIDLIKESSAMNGARLMLESC